MTRKSATRSADVSGEALLSRAAGLSLLSGIVLLTAAWLAYQGMRLEQASAPAAIDLDLSAALRSDDSVSTDGPWYGFVEIPAGPFLMGSDPRQDRAAFANERWSPTRLQGSVDLPTFYIGRNEVTVAEFKAFVRATGYDADPNALSGPDDYPVTYVSWIDALTYSRWLESSLGAALAATPETSPGIARLLRDGWHLSLPDEAQWEKAARGTDGRIYPWGNTPDRSRANFDSSGAVSTGRFECTECQFPVNDMSGNVWELTRSVYRPYPFDPASDWNDLDADALLVMRGGSFQDAANTVRAAVRGGVDPGARRDFIGFRLALSRPVP